MAKDDLAFAQCAAAAKRLVGRLCTRDHVTVGIQSTSDQRRRGVSGISIKSGSHWADAGDMIGVILPSSLLWLLVLLVAAWAVLMCLKVIGHEVEHAESLHRLKVEARQLKIQYRRRVRDRLKEARERARESAKRRADREAAERAAEAAAEDRHGPPDESEMSFPAAEAPSASDESVAAAA